MRIEVHIERLVLEGLPVSGRDRDRVHAAMAAELSRLIRGQGIARALRTGGAAPSVRADDVRVEHQASPRRLGTQIARAVYSGLGRQE